MATRELLIVRRPGAGEGAFALVDGSLPEVKAEFGVQDSITPLCREAQRVCGLTGNVGGA
ncbi:MAG: hypothetical protein JRG82_11800, partial [Deltaproteobacteria bacterium]|nr:hypothetical protein [Deltaproteobacteria bacterium]